MQMDMGFRGDLGFAESEGGTTTGVILKVCSTQKLQLGGRAVGSGYAEVLHCCDIFKNKKRGETKRNGNKRMWHTF